jgi:hypothetical protein
VCGKVIFPAIKELRYAGRRIVDALVAIESGCDKDANAYLVDALFDCYRARHDAVDAATAKISLDIKVISEKIGLDVVFKVYPDFANLSFALGEVTDKIAESRKDRENRDTIYASVESVDFPSLIKMYRKLVSCESLMKELAKTERKKALPWNVAAILSLVAGVLGAFLSYISIK